MVEAPAAALPEEDVSPFALDSSGIPDSPPKQDERVLAKPPSRYEHVEASVSGLRALCGKTWIESEDVTVYKGKKVWQMGAFGRAGGTT